MFQKAQMSMDFSFFIKAKMYMGLKCQSDSNIWGPIVNGADISGLKSQRELIWDWTQMGLKSVNLQYNTLGRLDDN